jgi:hypothetical protein
MTDRPVALDSSPPSTRSAWWPIVVVFAVAFLAVVFRTPWPATTIGDSDAGHQLAGAQQIAFGEHPFVDFRSTYGPLTFYVSFIDQWLSGWRIGADLLICTFAYAITYTLLFTAARWTSANNCIIPYATTLLAIIQLPRFYKYYILFGPAFVLFSLLWYVARPSMGRMLLAAVSIAVTGLYRPDMGAYAAITGCVAVAMSQRDWRSRLLGIVKLGALIVLVCSPWLTFLIARHHLLDYLRDSTFGAAGQAQGLSLPFPRPHADQRWNSPANLEAYAFLIWWTLPLWGAALLLLRWRRIDDVLRRGGVVTVILSALCLLQSAHRSEFHHLMQALAPSYVLAAFVAGQLLGINRSIAWSSAVTAILLLPAGVSVAAGWSIGSISGGSLKSVVSYPRFYFHDRREFVRRVGEKTPGNDYVRLVEVIDEQTKPGDRILAVPFLPTLYYFTGRRFAGGQMLVAPGYFSTEADQRRLVQTLANQGNPTIIEWTRGGAFDGLPTREIRSFAPLFYAYVHEAYEPVNDPRLPADYTLWRARADIGVKDGRP